MKEGINTYRVCPIIMQNRDGDKLISELLEKVESGTVLKKEDLVPLTLCPLMGGTLSQKQRIWSALTITRNAGAVDAQIIEKIEAVIYAMAEKFLDQNEKKMLREVVKMTELGQMLVNDGIERGIEKTRIDLVKKKLQKGKTVEEIADALEESVEVIQELIAKVQSDKE